jgi:hypothetical protein
MTLRQRHVLLVALAALALRGPWLFLSSGAPFDMESYARVARVGAAGLYTAAETAGRYPYLPLWWCVLKLMGALQALFGGPLNVWARVPGVLGDVAISALLYTLVERRSRSSAALAAGPQALLSTRAGLAAGLGWALNPLAALISAGHGQFDSLPLACLLAAAWWLEYSSDHRASLWAALSLAAAISLKTWPLAFLPLYMGVFASRREAVSFALLALFPCALLLAPFAAFSGLDAVSARLGYSGASALGFSGALRACFFAVDAPVELYHQADDLWRLCSLSALVIGCLWALWRARRLRLLDALPWMALSLILFAPGLSPQYLAWPAAFSLLVSGGYAWRYHLASFPLLVAFYALFMPGALAGEAAWAPPSLAPGYILLWAALNLGWWAWAWREWMGLRRKNLAWGRGGVLR